MFKWLYLARWERVKSWIIANIFNRQATQAGVDGAIQFILYYFSFSFLPSNIKAFFSSSSVCHLANSAVNENIKAILLTRANLRPYWEKNTFYIA